MKTEHKNIEEIAKPESIRRRVKDLCNLLSPKDQKTLLNLMDMDENFEFKQSKKE